MLRSSDKCLTSRSSPFPSTRSALWRTSPRSPSFRSFIWGRTTSTTSTKLNTSFPCKIYAFCGCKITLVQTCPITGNWWLNSCHNWPNWTTTGWPTRRRPKCRRWTCSCRWRVSTNTRRSRMRRSILIKTNTTWRMRPNRIWWSNNSNSRCFSRRKESFNTSSSNTNFSNNRCLHSSRCSSKWPISRPNMFSSIKLPISSIGLNCPNTNKMNTKFRIKRNLTIETKIFYVQSLHFSRNLMTMLSRSSKETLTGD